MADQGHEYEQYAPQSGGRLFGSAMFGFNKEEVLEYLDEMADENYQRQEIAEMRIQELSQKIQNLEAAAAAMATTPALSPEMEAELTASRQQVENLTNELAQRQAQIDELSKNGGLQQEKFDELNSELEIAKAATQQSEEELQESKEQLYNIQQENAWLRDEYQKSDQQIAELRRQLDEVSSGQFSEAEQQIAALKQQLLEAQQQHVQLQQQAAQLQQQTVRLNTKLAEASASSSDMAKANQQIADLKQQITDLKHELEQASSSVSADVEKQLDELRSQLEEASSAQWAAEDQVTELRQQLEEALDQVDELEGAGNPTSAAIIAEANAEADRILEQAYAERDRLHRQIRSSAGGLAESITNLRVEVSDVEGDVSEVLELVQSALSDVLVALGRTEQNLNTMGVQVERFPSASPAAPKPQPPVYFQPGTQITAQNHPSRRQEDNPIPTQSYGQGGFHRISPANDLRSSGSNIRPFKPTYSTSQGSYWPQATAAAYDPQEDAAADDQRLRTLTETLVETLRQMMN